MCGIAGILGDFREDFGIQVVDRMLNTIVHRGPDDSGSYAIPGVAVGTRRLSIIDLAGGHQPMRSANGTVIAFNGEIFNYRDLRSELLSRGFSFRTECDTEVVLNLYLADGIDCLRKLEGMFGICIVDPAHNSVYLIRDRLGIKPLYYGLADDALYFSSEVKAILAGMKGNPGLDLQALNHLLTLQYVPGPRTAWESISKIEPGSFICYSLKNRTCKASRYWSLSFKSQELEDGRDYPSEFESLFLSTVRKHLFAADVPVGVLLSGGLDSSAIAAAAVESGHRNFHTFTVSLDDDPGCLPPSRAVASHIRSHHHEIVISQSDFIEFMDDLVWFMDEPIAATASVPIRYVSRLARDYVKVVLSGEGGDEILGGYNMDAVSARADKRRTYSSWIPRSVYKLLSHCSTANFAPSLPYLYNHGWSGYLRARPSHMTFLFSESEKNKLWRTKHDFESTEDLIRSWYDLSISDDPLDQLQQVYCHSWLPENLLTRADKMSMAESIELRVPFVDHRLAEWAATLPKYWKTGSRQAGYTTKRVLREFVRRHLPPTILDQKKRGFLSFSSAWFSSDRPLGKWAEAQLINKNSSVCEIFEPQLIQDTLTRCRNGNGTAARQLWLLLVLERWLKRWH